MKNIQIEIKWALIFSVTGLVWMVLEKLCGLHGKYIDYHLYLTNLFAIPAVSSPKIRYIQKYKIFLFQFL